MTTPSPFLIPIPPNTTTISSPPLDIPQYTQYNDPNDEIWLQNFLSTPPTNPYLFPTSSQFPTRSIHYVEAAISLVQSKAVNALTMKSSSKEDAMGDMQHLLDRIQLDLTGMNFVHIAGSKGKGSTSSYTESILHQHGYKTGLYTSPHLINVRERFRINTNTIDEDLFCQHFWSVWDKLLATLPPQDISDISDTSMLNTVSNPQDKSNSSSSSSSSSNGTITAAMNITTPPRKHSVLPAFFSLLTLVALSIYKHEKIDVVVCEVGLGGKLDATNIIPDPLCTAVTTLSLEHREILGNSLDKIAHEKCGIFKQNSPIVVFPQKHDAWDVVLSESKNVGIKPVLIDTTAGYRGVELGILGDFQRQNVNMAVVLSLMAMRELKKRGIEPMYRNDEQIILDLTKNWDNGSGDSQMYIDLNNQDTIKTLKKLQLLNTTSKLKSLDDLHHEVDISEIDTDDYYDHNNNDQSSSDDLNNEMSTNGDILDHTNNDSINSTNKFDQNNISNELSDPFGSSTQLRKIKKTLYQFKKFEQKNNNTNTIPNSSSLSKNIQIPTITDPNSWYENTSRDLDTFLTYLDNEPHDNDVYKNEIEQELINSDDNNHHHNNKQQKRHKLLHSASHLHPSLSYPTFHINTLSPQIILGICKTQLRGRCDLVETFDLQEDSANNLSKDDDNVIDLFNNNGINTNNNDNLLAPRKHPKTTNIQWYIDGAHTNESIRSSTAWFQESTMGIDDDRDDFDKKNFINLTNSETNQDTNTTQDSHKNDKPSLSSSPSSSLKTKQTALDSLLHHPTEGLLHDTLTHSLTDSADMIRNSNNRNNRMLLFNCGHVRSSFSLMEPLIETLIPFRKPITLHNSDHHPHHIQKNPHRLPYRRSNSSGHENGNDNDNDPTLSNTKKQTLQSNINNNDQYWTLYLDSMFEHVFFCPFDLDKPHPIPLPTLEQQFNKRFNSNTPGDGDDDVEDGDKHNKLERSSSSLSSESSSSSRSTLTTSTRLLPKKLHFDQNNPDENGMLQFIKFNINGVNYTMNEFQSILQSHHYLLSSVSNTSVPTSSIASIEQSIARDTSNNNATEHNFNVGVDTMKWQLGNMVIWDFLTSVGLLQQYTNTDDYAFMSKHGHSSQNTVDGESSSSQLPSLLPETTLADSHATLSLLTSLEKSIQTGLYSKPTYTTHSYDYTIRNKQYRQQRKDNKDTVHLPQWTSNVHQSIPFHPPIATLTRNFALEDNNDFTNHNDKNNNNDNQIPTNKNINNFNPQRRRSMQYHVMPTTNDVILAIKHLSEQYQSDNVNDKDDFISQQQQYMSQEQYTNSSNNGRKITPLHPTQRSNKKSPHRSKLNKNGKKDKNNNRRTKKTQVYVTGSLYLAGNVLKGLKAKV